MMAVGAILATHFTLWIGSLKIEGVSVSVASSVILVTSHPLIVGVLSHFVLRERLNAWMALGIGLGFSGVVVIAIADSTARSASLVGDLLAFFGGVAAGFYFLAGRRLRQNIPLLAYAFVVYLTATGVRSSMLLGSTRAWSRSAMCRGSSSSSWRWPSSPRLAVTRYTTGACVGSLLRS